MQIPAAASALKKHLSYLAPRVLLAVLPLFLLYSFFEFALFKPLIPHLPLRYQQRLPEPLQMLAQPSKKATMPSDYVLILGDSHAAGWGDWILTADPGKNLPYGTHDLLHDTLGRDVVHSGFPGGSVLDVLVRKPVNRYRYLRKMWIYKPEDPKHVLWFFYEGNDLYDNIFRLKGHFSDKLDMSRVREEAYFREFLDTEVLKSDALYYDVRKFHKRWYYQYPSAAMFREIFKHLFYKEGSAEAEEVPVAPAEANHFRQGAGTVHIERGDVQAPPMRMTDDEFELSYYVTGECLDYLREFFPDSKFTIVYLPSVITSYPIASETVAIKPHDQPAYVANTADVLALSDRIFTRIEALARERGMGFLDTRAAFREGAERHGPLHGPLDWSHINKQGYEVLARFIASHADLS